MGSRPRNFLRLGLVGAAVAASTTLAVPALAADSLSYTCDYVLGAETGTFAATGNLGSNTDGRRIPLNSEFEHRVSGSVTLSQEYVDVLRDTGARGVSIGLVRLHTTIKGLDGDYPVSVTVDDVLLPEEGPLTLGGEGDGRPIVVQEPGTFIVTAGALEFSTGIGPLPDSVTCAPTGGADMTIGTFTVPGVASPSPTPSETISAERPTVVQTDFAGEDRASALPLVLAGLVLTAAAGGLTTWRARSRSGTRRH